MERLGERRKKVQRCYEGNYIRQCLYSWEIHAKVFKE